MSIFDQFDKTLSGRHEVQVAAGLHDDGCEWRANGHWVCHCSKRKREAEGYATPPDDLTFDAPTCPRCYDQVSFDDSYYCDNCKCRWAENGTCAEFTDDYGDIDPTPWDERAAEEKAKAAFLATAIADPVGQRLATEAVALAVPGWKS